MFKIRKPLSPKPLGAKPQTAKNKVNMFKIRKPLSPKTPNFLIFENAAKYQNFVASVALPGQHLASPVFF